MLSQFVLMLWVFLTTTVQMGWWAVDGKLIGFVGLAAVVIFVLECVGVVGWTLPGRK